MATMALTVSRGLNDQLKIERKTLYIIMLDMLDIMNKIEIIRGGYLFFLNLVVSLKKRKFLSSGSGLARIGGARVEWNFRHTPNLDLI